MFFAFESGQPRHGSSPPLETWDCASIRRLASSQLASAERGQIPESWQCSNELNQGIYWHIFIQCGKSESVRSMRCLQYPYQSPHQNVKRSATAGSAILRKSGISGSSACTFPIWISVGRVSVARTRREQEHLLCYYKNKMQPIVDEGMQDYIYCSAPGRSVILCISDGVLWVRPLCRAFST